MRKEREGGEGWCASGSRCVCADDDATHRVRVQRRGLIAESAATATSSSSSAAAAAAAAVRRHAVVQSHPLVTGWCTLSFV